MLTKTYCCIEWVQVKVSLVTMQHKKVTGVKSKKMSVPPKGKVTKKQKANKQKN